MANPAILVIDDETNLLRLFAYHIKALGMTPVTGETAADFRRLIGEREYSAVLLDMMLPDGNGLELLAEAHQLYPELPIIIITAYGSIPKAVEAMRLGAFDFVPKPVDPDTFGAYVRKAVEHYQLKREVRTLRRRLNPPEEFHSMVGASPAMVELYALIEQVAPTGATVMIQGESGTGKELVARAIHALSGRAAKPFVAINCAAIPHDLLESELFGHERGAFTGAVDQHRGCFERAHEGTLLLDEICEMDLALQAKLLRVLQEQSFYRIGGTRPIKVNVRIVAATNKDPADMVRQERFREDLYYRLNVVPIRLPPLRERREDIALLVGKFLREFSEANHRRFEGIERRALAALERYAWGGNVRELRNVIEQVVVLHDDTLIRLEMLPEAIRAAKPAVAPVPVAAGVGGEPVAQGTPEPESAATIQPMWQVERDQIQRALDLCGGNVQEAARRLEISPATLYRKIDKYGLIK